MHTCGDVSFWRWKLGWLGIALYTILGADQKEFRGLSAGLKCVESGFAGVTSGV
jgi:hypothetical protein